MKPRAGSTKEKDVTGSRPEIGISHQGALHHPSAHAVRDECEPPILHPRGREAGVQHGRDLFQAGVGAPEPDKVETTAAPDTPQCSRETMNENDGCLAFTRLKVESFEYYQIV